MARRFEKNSETATIIIHPSKKREMANSTEAPSVVRHSTLLSRVLWAIFSISLLVVFLWGLHSWMLHSDAFLLQSVDVRGNRILGKEDILKNIKFKSPIRLTDVQLSVIEKKIMKNPYLRSVIVYRKYPSTLEIEVEERSPIAYVSGKKVWMIDDEGVLLAQLKGNRALVLPVITHVGSFNENVGHPIENEKLQRAVWFLSTVKTVDKDFYYKINSVDYTEQKGMVVYLVHHPFPFYFGNDLNIRQIEYIQAILGKLKRDRLVSNIQYVDLRFANQVIVKR